VFVQLTITVDDVNDNWPQFTSPAAVTVAEDSPVGSSVFQLTATDADLDDAGRLTYRLLEDSTATFNVSARDGVVRTRRRLDRETTARYRLRFVAVDAGTPRRSTSVLLTVNVGDANDQAPRFTRPRYVAAVTDQLPVGAVVTTVSAVC